METKNKIINKLSNFLFFLSILFFTIGLNFQDTPPPNGWYQQFLPDINNMPISDIEFLDSLTGFAVTGDNVGNDTNYILKTTNGGDNWFINFYARRDFFRVIFLNSNTGYVSGGHNAPGVLYKTTNAGENWFTLNTPFAGNFDDMSVLNEDTIWVTDGTAYFGGLFRTTNGGQNWTQQFYSISSNPSKIYMYNRNIGFISRGASNGLLYKTTNSGLNWTQIPSEHGFLDMYFIDSLKGWKARGDMKKTTDGGLSWNLQSLPSGGIIQTSVVLEFSLVDYDTFWGVGGTVRYGPGNERGLIYKTTNSGVNWGYQIPDTSIHLWRYYHIDFVNKLNGWSFVPNSDVHTVTGGNDTTYYSGINQVSNEVPAGFKLYQNYPNPFNPSTKIRFDINKSAYVKLIVYDILGKEVTILVNEKLSTGSYEVDWTATSYPSGIYFYRLVTMPDGRQAEKFSETKKMLLIK